MVILALTLAIGGAIASNSILTPDWSKVGTGDCLDDTKPVGCSQTAPGILCTTGSGSTLKTFYRTSSCNTAWYFPDGK